MRKLGLAVVGITVVISLAGCGSSKDKQHFDNFVQNISTVPLPYNVKNVDANEQLDVVYLKNKSRIKNLYTFFETKFGGDTTYYNRLGLGYGIAETSSNKPNSVVITQTKLEELYTLNEFYYSKQNTSGVIAVRDYIVRVKGN